GTPYPGELRPHGDDRPFEPQPVRGVVQPPARAGRVGEWHDGHPLELEPLAHAREEAERAEDLPDGEPANGDDQPRPEQAELPLAPERAQPLLGRRRRPVAPAGRRPAGVAARDRGAVERLVERGLVEVEPAPERPARAAAPRPTLDALEQTGRLADEVRELPRAPLEDRQRLERVAGLGARPAPAVVALERGERAVARAAPRHAATSTNQRPSWSTRPPPSSARSPPAVKNRLNTSQVEPSCRARSCHSSRGPPS